MSNIASAPKNEIARVAKRDIRAETQPLKSAAAKHRSGIADLKRRVQALEQQLRRLEKNPEEAVRATVQANDTGPPRRFSASRLVAQRRRLGLSAEAFGKLIGVSEQSIYNWEQGKVRPRDQQLQTIADARGLSKRQAGERLESPAR